MLNKSFYCWPVWISEPDQDWEGNFWWSNTPDGVSTGSKLMQVFAGRGVFSFFSMAAGSLVSEGKWQEFKP